MTGRELQGTLPPGLRLTGGVLADECGALLREWSATRGRPR